jgi:hypothetical protein
MMATTQERLATLITNLGTDWKNLWAKIGTGALNTTATNLVAAINEVKVTADSAEPTPTATTTLAGKSELASDPEALAMSAGDRVLTPANLSAITNVNNGLVKLDGSGKVASAQLPSFVDDVLEVANFAALPGSGATGVIYVTLDTNNVYRWTGTVYAEIAASPGTTDDVTEGVTNLYFTNARADTRADGRITALIGDPDTDLAALYAAAKA